MRNLEERAMEFAREAHRGQTYGHGDFFELHLARVVDTLERFGVSDPALLAAGWLHDVVEDTPTTIETIHFEFGWKVADLVSRLTDEKGGNRRQRQEKTHARIRGSIDAVRVKLADRIANVEFSLETENPLLDGMYRKEYGRFRNGLYRRGEYEEMWAVLDGILL